MLSVQERQRKLELTIKSKFSKTTGGSSNLSTKVCDAWAGPIADAKNKRKRG